MPEENNSSKNQNLMVPIAIVVAGALIGVGIYFSPNSRGPVNQGNTSGAGVSEPVNLSREELLKGAVTIGDPNAPVLMIEFADFQCPFCGKFTRETRPLLLEQYVKTGKILLAYHDFAFLGPESTDAAIAGRCANDQGKFWQYHDYVYNYLWDNYYGKNVNGENIGALSKANLKKFAATLKLDTAAFNTCLDQDIHKQEVIDSTEIGRKVGISGTPGFLIDGKVMIGALPFSEFKKALDEALK